VLGAKVVLKDFIPSNQTDVVYVQIAGGMIELLHRRQPAAGEVYGITHIAFLSDDLDTDYRALVDSGCQALVEPKIAGTGVGRLAFLRIRTVRGSSCWKAMSSFARTPSRTGSSDPSTTTLCAPTTSSPPGISMSVAWA
jgi:hypothetical protein